MKTNATPALPSSPSWTSYATALGGLAAIGAVTPSADAGILYTDIPDLTKNTLNEVIHFDLDHSGPAPYAVLNGTTPGQDFQLRATGNAEVVTAVSFGGAELAGYYILKLSAGTTIDSSLPWTGAGGATYFEFFGTGAWEGGGDAYIGLRIPSGPDYKYGWAHLDYNDAGDQMTLKDFAIQQTLNAPILAGDIGAAPLPEPGTAFFGLAAALGVAARRRREAPVA